MKSLLVFGALLALASAVSLYDENDSKVIRDDLNILDIKTKERLILKLLNHILQRTVYKDIEDVARTYDIETNFDKYTKMDIVKKFILDYKKVGMLPRGEIFMLNNERQMKEVIRCFHVLYYAKDFDTFFKTACWMREHINEGMFVYALTVACIHREDCRGIVLPTPYEIYPYYFVNSDVIQKAYMIKMQNGHLDKKLLDYYGIRITDKNVVVIDTLLEPLTHTNEDDVLRYFTEDVDLNTYYYYFHVTYPMWMGDDAFGINKERRGELYYYFHQQLIARYNLERLSKRKCDLKMLNWDLPLKTGYWPRLRLHNGFEMLHRNNDVTLVKDRKIHEMRMVDDYERRIRDAIFKGHITTREGVRYELRKPEDIEILGRYVQGVLDKDDVKFYRYLMVFMRSLLLPTDFKHTVVPNVLDQYETCLRDTLCWKLQQRLVDNFLVYKKLLVPYTREELDFPGVKIDNIRVDKLVTYLDDLKIDITNALYLNDEEVKKERSDLLYVARNRVLNHKDFKINLDVVSDKTVDAVVRLFIGPKYDCKGHLMDLNDRRTDFFEIDSFLYKLKTGKNLIVRDSREMHNVLYERVWAKNLLDNKVVTDIYGLDMKTQVDEKYWYMQRIGFPHRLLLPIGRKGGLDIQIYAIITPVRTGKTLNMVDMDTTKLHHNCRYTVCIDTMPLGYPFDRVIDYKHFMTNNMVFYDTKIFHKNLDGKSMRLTFRDLYRLGRNYDDRLMGDIKMVDDLDLMTKHVDDVYRHDDKKMDF